MPSLLLSCCRFTAVRTSLYLSRVLSRVLDVVLTPPRTPFANTIPPNAILCNTTLHTPTFTFTHPIPLSPSTASAHRRNSSWNVSSAVSSLDPYAEFQRWQGLFVDQIEGHCAKVTAEGDDEDASNNSFKRVGHSLTTMLERIKEVQRPMVIHSKARIPFMISAMAHVSHPKSTPASRLKSTTSITV